MTLFLMQDVTKAYRQGRHVQVVLNRVTCDIAAGEFIGVWGRRRSGRTTLLRMMGGIERPDSGKILFAGDDITNRSYDRLLGRIALAQTFFIPEHGERCFSHVAVPLRRMGMRREPASIAAQRMLDRVGAGDCAERQPRELDQAEQMLVGIARALVTHPQVLLVDDPTLGLPAPVAQRVLRMLRSIAKDDGIAVVVTAGETQQLAGVDRSLAISAGDLRGRTVPETAEVVPFGRRADSR